MRWVSKTEFGGRCAGGAKSEVDTGVMSAGFLLCWAMALASPYQLVTPELAK